MTERRQEVTFGLALLLVLGTAVGLEFGFRALRADDAVLGVDWPAMVATIGEIDPATQRAHFVPGARFGEMQFNSFGLRGPEVPMPQPTDLVRIAFLGDSKVMSANYAESQSFSGQVVAQLAALVPQCRFDYVTMAGPGYTVPVIADLWTEIAPATLPDFAVVLAGTIGEMILASRSDGVTPDVAAPEAGQTWLDGVLAQSWLLAAAQRQLFAISGQLAPPPPAALDLSALAATHRAIFAPLVKALGDTPVLALGYRGRLSDDQSLEDQARFARDLQLVLPGLTVAEAIVLTELNVAEMARLAQELGWQFADPIAGLPKGESHFVDNQHFSTQGLADIAADIATQIAARVQPDCTIAHTAGTF